MGVFDTTGHFLPVDENAIFINLTTLEKLAEKWHAAIIASQSSLLTIFNKKLISVYLRGSAAVSNCIDNVSDIDLLIITSSPFYIKEQVQLGLLQKDLKIKFPFVLKFDFETICYESFFIDSDYNTYYQFLIKTQSMLIVGKNIDQYIKPFGIHNIPLFQLSTVQHKIEKTIEFLNNDRPNSGEVIKRCRWVFKAIIRAGFEKTIVWEQKYSRDVFLNCEIFCKYFPDCNIQMQQALKLAIYPISDLNRVLDKLLFFRDWFKQN